MRPCNHIYWLANHVSSIPVDSCSPIGLWEGLTITPHINKLWQQLRIARSHWTVKDGVEGLVLDGILSGVARDLEVKDVDLWLNPQMQISQGILGICLWDVALHWDYKALSEVVLWSTLEGWIRSHVEIRRRNLHSDDKPSVWPVFFPNHHCGWLLYVPSSAYLETQGYFFFK